MSKIVDQNKETEAPPMRYKEEEFVFSHSAKSILEIIEDATKDVPQSERESLPKDLAENHDRYLYGNLKN